MTHSSERTPEDLYSDFLRRKDRSKMFEEWVSQYPGLTEALYRLHLAHIGLNVERGPTDSIFYSPPRRPTPEQLELKEGDTIGAFELTEPLGQGGMGEVWKAFQVSLERNVALKFIRSDRPGDRMVRRFRIEARAGGKLNHPNLVSVFDTGYDDGRYWISQELVEGGCTLRDVIDEQSEASALPKDYDRHVARLFYRIAKAMEVAHAAGIVHRDIKPNNILVTKEDEPKVGDFGLALMLDEGTISMIGLEGTPYYMSPEQAAAKAIGIDSRSDIFSLGAVFYEMLTFRRPFDGDTSEQVLERIIHVDPVEPHKLARRIPDELNVIAMGCLEKLRSDRYQSMSDVAEDLRRYLADEPILRKPPGPLKRVQKWSRRHPTAAVALVLGGLLLGVLGSLGPELMSQRGRSQAAERDTHLVQARWAIDRGDLDLALAEVEEAIQLDPEDARGHVYLASGYFQYARDLEAEQQIQLATEKGFSTDPPVDGTAEDHLAYALYVLVTRKSLGWAAAEQHLEEALAKAPDLEGALFNLYQLRKMRGDDAGSRTAIESFRQRLELGDPFVPVTAALLLELEGDCEGAIELLEGAEIPREGRARLRYGRILGRNQFLIGDYAGALASLEEHLTDMPADALASEYLAQTHLRLADAGASDDALEHARIAIDAVRASIEWDPARAHPYAILAEAYLDALGAMEPYEPLPAEDVRAAREAIEAWRERDPVDPLLPLAEAQLDFLVSLEAFGADREDEAIELLERAVGSNPVHTIAHVILGQKLRSSDPDASRAHFQSAVDGWSDDRPRNPRWLFSAHVELFGHAARAGDVDAARSARESAEDVLADGFDDGQEELFTYAEYLALAPDELRDCARAQEVLDDHGLREYFAGHAMAEELLRQIDASCR